MWFKMSMNYQYCCALNWKGLSFSLLFAKTILQNFTSTIYAETDCRLNRNISVPMNMKKKRANNIWTEIARVLEDVHYSTIYNTWGIQV